MLAAAAVAASSLAETRGRALLDPALLGPGHVAVVGLMAAAETAGGRTRLTRVEAPVTTRICGGRELDRRSG